MRWTVAILLGGPYTACREEEHGPVSWTDEATISYTGALVFEPVEVAEATDVVIDWSGLGEDLLGAPLDPTTLDLVGLTKVLLGRDELQETLGRSILLDHQTPDVAQVSPDGGTTAALVDLHTPDGESFDPTLLVEDADVSWLLTFAQTEGSPFAVRMLAVLVPSASSGESAALVGPSAASWSASVDFRDGLVVPPDVAVELDWSDVTQDLRGLSVGPSALFSVLYIARYEGSVEEVEAAFPSVGGPTDLYTLDVFGERGADLSAAMDVEGTPFSGFTPDGTWLVGLCDPWSPSPLPLLLTWAKVDE